MGNDLIPNKISEISILVCYIIMVASERKGEGKEGKG